MAWVYILKNNAGRYYLGSTSDLQARLKHHEGGFTPSTKRLGEMKLIFSQEYSTLDEARRIERKLKSLKRKDYIDKIVKDGEIRLRA